MKIALIIIAGTLVYINSFSGKFLRDDNFLIKDNDYIKDWSNMSLIFTKNIAEGAGRRWYSYRPLQMITYIADYSLWRLKEEGYHLTNLLLHILTALSVYWLFTILFRDKLLSFLTGIFFVIHPIHTEAVSFISGRADPLAALLMLISFILYVKGKKVFMLLSYILALLSRENALILPVLLLLYHYAFKIRLKNREFLSMLCIALIYLAIRVMVLRSLLIHHAIPTTLLQRIPGFFAAVTNYIKLLILPFPLHMEYGRGVFRITDPKAISGAVILLSLVFFAFKKRNNNILLFFSVSWFFLALLPQSNIYPLNAYMAEHWLYMPSIGFFLVLAKSLSSLYINYRRIAISFIISLISFYSFITIIQNRYWHDPVTFYERTLSYSPHSPDIYYNLGTAYIETGRMDKAVSLFKKTIELDPSYVKAYLNLGISYRNTGALEDAISVYKKAVEINPDYAHIAYNNLGSIYGELGDTDEAIALLKKAIELEPSYSNAYNNLGLIYNNLNRTEEAIVIFKKAIEIQPGFVDAYNNLGAVLYNNGRYEEALDVFRKVLDIDPDNTTAYKYYLAAKEKIK